MHTIQENKEGESVQDRAVSISPAKGSQGAPEVDLSSQDIDWDLIQDENGRESEVTELEIGNGRTHDKRDEEMVIAKADMVVPSHEGEQVEEVIQNAKTVKVLRIRKG